MRYLLLILLSLSFSQYPPYLENLSETDKILAFQDYKKKPALGVIYSIIAPFSLGHTYSGTWKTRGVKFFIAKQISAQSYNYFINYAWTDKESLRPHPVYYPIAMISSLSMLVFTIWERVDAANQVKKYNDDLYRYIFKKEPPSFVLNLESYHNNVNLNLTYNF